MVQLHQCHSIASYKPTVPDPGGLTWRISGQILIMESWNRPGIFCSLQQLLQLFGRCCSTNHILNRKHEKIPLKTQIFPEWHYILQYVWGAGVGSSFLFPSFTWQGWTAFYLEEDPSQALLSSGEGWTLEIIHRSLQICLPWQQVAEHTFHISGLGPAEIHTQLSAVGDANKACALLT